MEGNAGSVFERRRRRRGLGCFGAKVRVWEESDIASMATAKKKRNKEEKWVSLSCVLSMHVVFLWNYFSLSCSSGKFNCFL